MTAPQLRIVHFVSLSTSQWADINLLECEVGDPTTDVDAVTFAGLEV